jgi:hypothetical protein
MMSYEPAIATLEPLLKSNNPSTRQMTYPLLEACYQGTNRMIELYALRQQMVLDNAK